MRLPRLPLLLLPVLCAGGCATMFNGQRQDVTVTSTPPGADIYVQGANRGRTPATIPVKRAADREVTLVKDGYKPSTVTLKRSVDSSSTSLNIFVGGSFCTTTDFMTGSAFEYDPDHYDVPLAPLSDATPAEKHWRQVYEFALGNYKALQLQAAQGGGEALTTLRTMMGIPTDQQAAWAKELLQLAEDKPVAEQWAAEVATRAKAP